MHKLTKVVNSNLPLFPIVLSMTGCGFGTPWNSEEELCDFLSDETGSYCESADDCESISCGLGCSEPAAAVSPEALQQAEELCVNHNNNTVWWTLQCSAKDSGISNEDESDTLGDYIVFCENKAR